MSQTLYVCDGCSETIPAGKARLHCDSCPGIHDVCANCYVVGRYTRQHVESHSCSMIVESGYQPKPPPMPPRPQATTPQRGPPTAELVYRPSPSQAQQKTTSSASPSSQAAVKPAAPTGWQPLFSGSKPTKCFVDFLTLVFGKIDKDGDGLLTPEQYSSFLDVQQYALEEDVWKKFHKPQWVYTADDVADYELTTSYENWSVSFVKKPRPGANTAASGRSFTNDMMPMLTLPGFIDITVVETLYEPSPGWIRVNLIAKHYGIWRGWGDCPRSMMPQAPPRDLVERVGLVTRQSALRNKNRIEANARKLQANLDGQEAALRLLDPPGTRYYYS